MNRLNYTDSAIFVSLMCSLLPEDLHSELILNLHNQIHKKQLYLQSHLQTESDEFARQMLPKNI